MDVDTIVTTVVVALVLVIKAASFLILAVVTIVGLFSEPNTC